jgi:hypothetical protein
MRRKETMLWIAIIFITMFYSNFGYSYLLCLAISTAVFEFGMRTVWLFLKVCLFFVFSVSQFHRSQFSIPTS